MLNRLVLLCALLGALCLRVEASAFSCVGGSVYVIAHPDDDLLFQSPTLLDDVQGGDCITTVILTAGDSGTGLDYAESREAGNQAAYAQMAGVDDSHTEFYATFGGQPVLIRTLVAAPQVQKVYFRLPDGNMDGSGFSATGFQSIRSLYFGTIPSITNLPGDATFTRDTLKEAIAQILAARQPDRVRTLDHLSDYSAGDHADHLTAGRITSELVGSYAPAADFAGYMGYPVQNLAPTISQDSAEFAAKCDAFFAYTPFDYAECQSFAACAGRGESSWLQREYAVTPNLATTTSGDGTAQTPVTLPDGENLASRATATASSYSEGSPPSAAIDGVLGGYPTDESAEWVSDHEGVGAWLKLEWDTTVTITAIAIYDRPNLVDWLTTGTLTASDGAEISFTNTVNDGSAFLVTLPQGHSTTSLLLTVTGVSSGTENVGLSELQVFGTCDDCATPSPTTTSDPAGPTATGGASGNLARNATAGASSWAEATQQTPDKAIDGIISGYREDGSGDYTKEWASDHETAGAYFTLDWVAPVVANRFVLYDRPNLDDQLTSGSITFSDGSTLPVPALNNDGSATTIDFAEKEFDSLVLSVLSTSNTTSSVGLAEFEIFYLDTLSTTSSITTIAPSSTRSVISFSSASSPTSGASSSAVSGSGTSPSFSSTASSTSAAATPSSTLVNYARTVEKTPDVSSEASATEQTADKAIDGIVSGYKEDGTGDYTKEWATDHQGVGAWIGLSWATSITVNQVVLFDRPNLNDQILNASIRFSDDSYLYTGPLVNDGSATYVNFAARETDSLVITVLAVSSSTSSVGLAEVQVFNNPNVIVSTAAPSTTTASGSSSATSATPTSRSVISFSSTATQSLSSVASSTSTSSASSTSAAAMPSSTVVNYARTVEKTPDVSSEASATEQTADKAIDGIVSGYKEDGTGDYTKEWATDHQGVGAWIGLLWATSITVNQVVLFDRPNLNDQILNASIRFSDDSYLYTGPLMNDGSATYVNFTAQSTDSLVITVLSVSSSTSSVGLAEVQVFNNPNAHGQLVGVVRFGDHNDYSGSRSLHRASLDDRRHFELVILLC
ncbi:hypothetical protein Rhopal_007288-T1 [Rhodotorula paludigena]|uniref:N-acetylglucosaminylphosphatidylinositol deacetylase n=1 Tax=Rhodotorula paludigena TaxID=86838 RepID=A0AAV5GW69_9BASI|nr:hypothetical protein Rhopal_007288-T1 [Rhodotorula paludigena]